MNPDVVKRWASGRVLVELLRRKEENNVVETFRVCLESAPAYARLELSYADLVNLLDLVNGEINKELYALQAMHGFLDRQEDRETWR